MKRLPLFLLALGLSLTLLIAACGDDDDDDAATAPNDDAVVAVVGKALQAKNGWDPATVEVTLDRIEDGRYATGGVRDIPAGGGGLWFAALVDGDWRIVWDGNGVIDCPSLDPYPDFPTSMIPACFGADGTIKER